MNLKNRTLALAFGVTLASTTLIAGCDQYDQEGGKASASKEADARDGIGKNHGGDPKSYINCLNRTERGSVGEDDYSEPADCKFEPEYFHVIYMKFEADRAGPYLAARHAFFSVDPGGGDDKLDCAIEYLRRNEPKTEDCGVYKHPTLGRIRPSFDEMFYGSQQRIYAFVDNPDIAFNPITPIIFTGWGSHDNQFPNRPTTRKRNMSFGGARLVEVASSKTRALAYNNYFKNDTGNDFYANPDHIYSINFNLVMCKPEFRSNQDCDFGDPSTVIPIAVDPDTGNGQGRRPPG